ncbi:hypothetical protein DRH14_01795 [Candidatus Shapirobacteria bacterium]|nr:MAG: hypothetical protein DRH14_01795 [Candidatus Shapirobacteria bacterium]
MPKDIIKELKQKPSEFIFLVIMLLLASVLFFYFNYNPHFQRRVIYFTSGAYLFWSLFHHYKRGDLELSIVIEYLLIAIFAVVLMTTTLI